MQQIEEKKPRIKRLNVVSLRMVKESYFPYQTNLIRSPEDCAKLGMEYLKDADRESFVVICLYTNKKYKVSKANP
jgi:DNA repair protein RadC